MFQSPEPSPNLSMMLSEVLQDLGVTETMMKKTRRVWMIDEALKNTQNLLLDFKVTRHCFGSQSEASTTLGLESDIDVLSYFHDIQVIQDLSQWKPGMEKRQFLMVQDETVSPGYCLIQLLRPVHGIQNKDFSTDSRGRVLLRPSLFSVHLLFKVFTKHGPASSYIRPGRYDEDFVWGLYCPSWPKEAIPWLQQQTNSGWPTEQMKRYSADQGCFVVPVGSKEGSNKDLEWRISTSMAERCLMFSINITQLRCYILMKMIIKTFLKPVCGEAVSSFMCKNILFYRIAGSEVNSTWNEGSLLTRLNQCLQALLHCIKTENCPHFVIPRNNLLAGKLSADMKRQIEVVLYRITGNIEHSLLNIQIDDLGLRLREQLCGYSRIGNQMTFFNAHDLIDGITRSFIKTFINIQNVLRQNEEANAQNLINTVSKLDQLYREGSDFEKVAVSLLKQFLCTTIGSIKASADIQHSRNISPDAMKWFSLGLNSDVSSSRLKKASALYCAGDMEGCEMILADVSGKMAYTQVHSVCVCNEQRNELSADFGKICFEKNEDIIKHNMAVCVSYIIQCEINCIPGELKYEMFRSTEEDRPYRHHRYDFWMDWAAVDSKPYLYFLQSKVYSQLHRPADQQRALDNLARTIEIDPDLGHRETDLNLLGQCMEQKNWLQLALYCYKLSLTLMGRNNAANWHVCRLLARLVRRKP